MATFLEIKQIISKLFRVSEHVNETDDIIVPIKQYSGEEKEICIPNEQIKSAYDSYMQSDFKNENFTLYNSFSWETPVECNTRPPYFDDTQQVKDPINQIEFTISSASSDYLIFLLTFLVEENNDENLINVRRRIRMFHYSLFSSNETNNADIWSILSELLRLRTLKIKSVNGESYAKFRRLASSFEFLYMYRKSFPIIERNMDIFFGRQRIRTGISRVSKIDTPPQRIYNHDVIEYYMLALDSRDPFTTYISFYHVIEHYFDAVFRKNLTNQIREKITHPDFSYKDEEELYKLAKYIRKHMNSDEESGKGNELESLKYVLNEYIDIDELKKRIDYFKITNSSYYQTTPVNFTSSSKTLIAWSDTTGVYTNLANRIYETRNALVHSKSEQADNQYKPYRDKNYLIQEIPLIRAVAEQVIINSSEDI